MTLGEIQFIEDCCKRLLPGALVKREWYGQHYGYSAVIKMPDCNPYLVGNLGDFYNLVPGLR